MKLNYESCENCFVRTQHIASRLVYGDTNPQDSPFVTVAIPTYKRPELLKEAIASVLKNIIPPYQWELLIVDNEPDNGKPNLTESLVRKLKNKRIRYYRNSENMLPADNFNRCFTLARGKWVCMLHDDDLLLNGTLRYLGELLEVVDKVSNKPLGAITAGYIPFRYESVTKRVLADIPSLDHYFSSNFNFQLFQILHSHIWFTGHPGGNISSNGSIFNLEAIKSVGGFNSSFDDCSDLALLYSLENQYSVYQTFSPLGFYRHYANSLREQNNDTKYYKSIMNFQEYALDKWKVPQIVAKYLKKCWESAVGIQLEQRQNFIFSAKEHDSNVAYDRNFAKKMPYRFFNLFWTKSYEIWKRWQTLLLRKKIMRLR